jgi:hypothetical protein
LRVQKEDDGGGLDAPPLTMGTVKAVILVSSSIDDQRLQLTNKFLLQPTVLTNPDGAALGSFRFWKRDVSDDAPMGNVRAHEEP